MMFAYECIGNAKVFLLSFFKLVPDVRPAFFLQDDSGKIPKKDLEELRMKVQLTV